MGARSAAALAKRAEKRGMTVEEYCAYERTKDKEKKQVEAGSPSVDAEAQGRKRKAEGWPEAPRSRLGDWTCTACHFVNFSSRDACKQCSADAPSKEHREHILEARKHAKEEKQRNADPSRAWQGAVGKQVSRPGARTVD